MPLPKRPFTTNSLTSTLKSTIASQPLLSNLNNNIDKLSSQATSFAQKTPFFGAASGNDQQQQQQHDATSNPLPASQSSIESRAPSASSADMMRSTGGPQASGSGAQQQKPRQPMADTSPAVDMSHLTEEERLMIQSVMAKAEMADMGIPVDTSVPSSTNLPSNASNALVHQQQQAKRNQQQQQQQQHRQMPMTTQNNQQLQQNQQQPFTNQANNNNQQQQQHAQMNMMQANTSDYQQMNPSLGGQQSFNSAQDFQQQQQQIQQRQLQQQQQQQQHQPQQQQIQNQQAFHQNLQMQPVMNQQQASTNINSNTNQPSTLDARTNPIPSLEQQTQQLISQINSQFNLGGQNQPEQQQATRNVSSIAQQQQQQQPQPQNIGGQFTGNQMQQADSNQFRMQPSSINSFDQCVPGQQKMPSTSPIPQIQAADASLQQYPIDQRQIQQAQLDSIMQPNQRGQMDFGMTNPNVFAGQQIEPNTAVQQQQSQQYLGGLNKPEPSPNSYMANQLVQQSNPAIMNLRTGIINPGATGTVQSFMPQQQQSLIQPELQNMSSLGQPLNLPDFTMMKSNQFATGLQNPLVPASSVNYNSSEMAQQGFAPYQDPRSTIRFGQLQIAADRDYSDQALSDQEYHGGQSRRHHQANRGIRRYDSTGSSDVRTRGDKMDVKDRGLLAYDLAQRSQPRHVAGNKQGARQLPQVQPQDLHPRQPHSPNDHSSDRQQQHNNQSKKAKRSFSRSSSNRDAAHDSPRYLSDVSDEAETPAEETKKLISEAKRSPSNSAKENVDKNEEAMRLLSELKLTEQANQVMEQQQLLIKQSQELIKLQLEQQALSQELKKSIKQGANVSTDANSDNKNERNSNESLREEERNNQNPSVLPKQEQSEIDEPRSNDAAPKQKLGANKKSYEDESEVKTTRLESNKKNQASQGKDFDSDIDDYPRSVRKSTSDRFDEYDENSTFDGRSNRKSSEREKLATGRKTTLANSSAQTCPSPRYNRDVLHSPTDTTDSDIEPISQANMRRSQQRLNQQVNKPKGLVRRREPTGLPPSPLPVAAAIQLHQMQQQHFRQQVTAGVRNNVSRNNFTRSRSVTSSPNHHLEQTNCGGYLTDDNQRVRSTSPDTLSEFGGMRRRKRLPAPPTNAVPITPSMVRKMIQAQRAGANAGRMLTSVNAQSTLMNNTHTNRSLALDRGPNKQDNLPPTSRSLYGDYPSNPMRPFNQASSIASHIPQTQTTSANGNRDLVQPKTTSASDLNKFLSSTYGNSILKNNITDVKETPELDKLIGNLDDFYGLDNKTRHVRLAQPSNTLLNEPYSQTSFSRSSVMPPVTSSPTRLPSHTSGYPLNNSPASHALDYNSFTSSNRMYPGGIGSSYMSRRSSEGENILARINARRPYRQTNLDESYRNYGRNFTASSYLDGRSSSYLNSSPVKPLRYTNSAAIPDRLRDYSSGHLDNWDLRTAGMSRYDHPPQSNLGQPTARSHNSLATNPRLGSNPTRSFDCDSIDYMNDQRKYPSLNVSDLQAAGSSRYQSPYVNTSSVDPIRDDYRYPGISDRLDSFHNPSSRFQKDLTSGEFGPSARRFDTGHPISLRQFQPKSLDLDSRQSAYHLRPNQYTETGMDRQPSYLGSSLRYKPSSPSNLVQDYTRQTNYPDANNRSNLASNDFMSLTKNEIINSAPNFWPRTHNKYVAQPRAPIQCLQSSYPHPYKRILLSKNPKDKIGNGIGLRIVGGQSIPSLYDKVNKCIVTSGAFVTDSMMIEIKEGDQLIEWNGVNLCNRSDEEVQQILLSQFNDDEVEIVYLPREQVKHAYDGPSNLDHYEPKDNGQQDEYEKYADMNRPSGHRSAHLPPTSSYKNDSQNIRRKISLSSKMWSM